MTTIAVPIPQAEVNVPAGAVSGTVTLPVAAGVVVVPAGSVAVDINVIIPLVQAAGYTVTPNVVPPPPPTPTAPPAVSNLKGAAVGATVTLTWTNNGTLAGLNQTDGTNIYRDGVKIAWPGLPPVTTYVDSGVAAGPHTYTVGPYNGKGEGGRASVGVTVTIAPPPPPPLGKVPIGFYNGALSNAESLSATLGLNPLQGFSTYCDGSSWPSIAGYNPPPLPAGCRLLLGLNMDPDGGQGDLQVQANIGTFQQVARNLLAANLALPPICRPGWEFDGNWFSWGNGVNGDTPAAYSAAFRAIVLAMRAIYPGILFDLSQNTGSSTLAQLEAFYPGDDVVDFVGGDHYDKQGGGGDFSQFGAVVNLAHNHGKPLSSGEWGLNGADDPTFINDGAQVFNTPAAASARYGWPSYTVGYHSYFNAALSIDSVITNKPNSLAAFKSAFG